jgi:hypothetical protein
MPTSQVPTYLAARVAFGYAVPSVDVVSIQSKGKQEKGKQAGGNGERKAVGDRAEAAGAELHAMSEFVVKALNEELVIELLDGLPISRHDQRTKARLTRERCGCVLM